MILKIRIKTMNRIVRASCQFICRRSRILRRLKGGKRDSGSAPPRVVTSNHKPLTGKPSDSASLICGIDCVQLTVQGPADRF